MAHKIGKQTIIIDGDASVAASAAVGSKKEGEGPLGADFDVINEDSRFGEKTWEKAESTMQKTAANAALAKCGRALSDVDFIFAGDLLNQCIASGYGVRGAGVPFVGLYGACSTYAEATALGAVFVDGPATRCLAVASSHSLGREYFRLLASWAFFAFSFFSTEFHNTALSANSGGACSGRSTPAPTKSSLAVLL